ncbi:acetyltransferase [Intrasporangium oryzae NRRL B-24470]|uniref:Acetyltransferase n=1 Tax=Intrasporangium oryzae NRRL B-24470 TaxID=1386089 RepID=W9GEC2_9MICO|nr:GNAT family N-acetyltransferase [Intrasporangium oryzae]EWT02224.1 acetyltransferase [Intrasporangium oryzae NRRL B-24470]
MTAEPTTAEPSTAEPATTDLNDLALPGFTWRPLEPSDAHDVFTIMAACELETLGSVVIEEADIVGDWQRPSFDIASQTIGVLDGGRLVGYAEVAKGRRAEAAVHPDHRGRGIGTALALWTQRVSRRDGKGLVGQPAPEGSAAEALFRGLGYEPLWTSWVLEMPEGKQIEPQPIPDGYAIRAADGDADHRAAHEVIEDAFLEWSDRERETFEDFAANTVLRPGFEAWNLRLMTDPAGDAVGAMFVVKAEEVGYVDKLAVRRDQRGLGLARALLVDGFAVAREHGATRSELSTDSRTGALGLYEKVGMEVTSVWKHWAIDTSDQA